MKDNLWYLQLSAKLFTLDFVILKLNRSFFLHRGPPFLSFVSWRVTSDKSHSCRMENNNIDVYLLSSSTPPVHCAGHPTNVHQDDDKNRSQPGQRGQHSGSRGNCSIHYFRLSDSPWPAHIWTIMPPGHHMMQKHFHTDHRHLFAIIGFNGTLYQQQYLIPYVHFNTKIYCLFIHGILYHNLQKT